MKIPSILQGINAYQEISNKPTPNVANSSFKNMVVEFNKLSKMDPSTIMSLVSSTQNSRTAHVSGDPIDNVSFAAASFSELREKVKNSEKTGFDNAAGKASATELAVSVTQAKLAVDTFSQIRTQVMGFIDKIFNMNV